VAVQGGGRSIREGRKMRAVYSLDDNDDPDPPAFHGRGRDPTLEEKPEDERKPRWVSHAFLLSPMCALRHVRPFTSGSFRKSAPAGADRWLNIYQLLCRLQPATEAVL